MFLGGLGTGPNRIVALVIAGLTLASVGARAQTRLPNGAPDDPFARPVTADPGASPSPTRTQAATPPLRGTVPPTPPAPTPSVRARTPPRASFVVPAPSGPRAQTQRQVQGAVQPEVQRPVQGPILAPVYDPRASTLGEGAPPTPPLAPRPRRPSEDDPFAPTGLRVGSFILRPAVEAGLGFTDNANGTTTAPIRSGFSRVAAEAQLNSDWSAHALGLRLRTERQDFFARGADERTTIEAQSTLRLDVTRDTIVNLGALYRSAPDTANTFNLPVTAVGRPTLETRTLTAGVTQHFGKALVELRGQYDMLRFGTTPLSDGTTQSNAVRDENITTGTLRLGYNVVPAFQPFAEVTYNIRDFRQPIDNFGMVQGSQGTIWRGGYTFDLGPKLNGEIAVGYLIQRPKEPGASAIEGLTLDGFLNWSVSPLTLVRLTAKSGVLDTNTQGATGGITREVGLSIEHALRRNLTLTGSIAYGTDDYSGIIRTDRRLTAALSTLWRLNRTVALKATATHQRIDSSVPGNNQSTTTVEAGVRLEW